MKTTQNMSDEMSIKSKSEVEVDDNRVIYLDQNRFPIERKGAGILFLIFLFYVCISKYFI